VLTILTVAPACLSVILLGGAAMNIVLPTDTVQFSDAVMHDMRGSMTIQRVACAIGCARS